MAGNSTIDYQIRNLRNIFAVQRISENDENAFCTLDNIPESLTTLAEVCILFFILWKGIFIKITDSIEFSKNIIQKFLKKPS